MGRSRGRRRLLAVSLVLASATGALALTLSPSANAPESNPFMGTGSDGMVVFAVRNTETVTRTITGWLAGGGVMEELPLAKPGAVPIGMCTDLELPIGLDNSTASWTLAPGEVKQFKVTPKVALMAGDHSCVFQSTGDSPAQVTVTVTFHNSLAATIDVQPKYMDFGPKDPNNTEVQTVVMHDYSGAGGNVTFQINGDTTVNNFSLGCGSDDTCTLTLAPLSTASTTVHCNGGGSSTATLVVTAPGGTSQVALSCDAGAGITLSPDPLPLIGAQGSTVPGTVNAMGNGSATASFLNPPPGFMVTSCASGCSLPASIGVSCVPQAASATATLEVTGPAGTATSQVQCTSNAAPPSLVISPSTRTFAMTDVGSGSDDTVTISNAGGGTLTNVVLSLSGADAPSFSFDECSASSPCSIVSGTPKQVAVHFNPQRHGNLLATLGATAAGPGMGSGSSQSTGSTLAGTGLGGVMVVTNPAGSGYHLELGTVPLGATGSATIELLNSGNAQYTATITNNDVPYALSATSTTVNGNGGTAVIDVTCSSATPRPNNDQTWTISATGAYQGTPQDITVSCGVADTNVVVDPLSFDFGEVRVGASASPMPLTVTNPGPGSVMLSAMQLRLNKPGLSLSPPMTSMTLPANGSAGATLTLDTSADTDLTGELVDVTVGSATLSLPVRGKVVTPHSRIAPATLDLGTACAGTAAMGDIRLINDGTATLMVDEPEMDTSASFYAVTAQTMWPAEVAAGAEIVATVMPAPSTTGAATGVLTWRDDSPATYEVPITLEYISSGTALSPRGLDFGTVAVEGLATSQRVTLENCDPEVHFINVKQLKGIKGPIGAWIIDPKVGYAKDPAPNGKQAVPVTFAPPGRGHYEAELLVETDSGEETIKLVGDATGKAFDSTSFYACSCNAPGVPWQGWPLAVSVLIVSARRRRRGSSSPR